MNYKLASVGVLSVGMLAAGNTLAGVVYDNGSPNQFKGTSNNRVFHILNIVWRTTNVAKYSFD